MPVACVTGDPMRLGAPGVIHGRMCPVSASSVRWLCITPFGSLVVPEVYASTHTSSGSAAATADAGAASATMSQPTRRTLASARRRRCADDDVQLQVGQLVGGRAVDDVEIVDGAVPVGGDVGARPALAEDEAHLLRAVDVHDRHEHVAADREPVERDDGLVPVRELERDDRAGLDPGVGERGDEAERVGVQVGVGAVPRTRLRPDVDPCVRERARSRRSTRPPSVSSVHQPDRRRSRADRRIRT